MSRLQAGESAISLLPRLMHSAYDFKPSLDKIVDQIFLENGPESSQLNGSLFKTIIRSYSIQETRKDSTMFEQFEAAFDRACPSSIKFGTPRTIKPLSAVENSNTLKYFKAALKRQVVFSEVELDHLMTHASNLLDMQLLNHVFQNYSVPKLHAYSRIIDAYGRKNDPQTAKKYFQLYLDSDLNMSASVFTSFANALVFCGDTPAAIDMLTRISKSYGLKIPISSFNGAIRNLTILCQFEDAEELYEMMKDEEEYPNPNTETVSLAIIIKTVLGKFDEAFAMYDPLADYSTSRVFMGYFARACLQNNQIDTARKIFKQDAGSDITLFIGLTKAISELRLSDRWEWFDESCMSIKNSGNYG